MWRKIQFSWQCGGVVAALHNQWHPASRLSRWKTFGISNNIDKKNAMNWIVRIVDAYYFQLVMSVCRTGRIQASRIRVTNILFLPSSFKLTISNIIFLNSYYSLLLYKGNVLISMKYVTDDLKWTFNLTKASVDQLQITQTNGVIIVLSLQQFPNKTNDIIIIFTSWCTPKSSVVYLQN